MIDEQSSTYRIVEPCPYRWTSGPPCGQTVVNRLGYCLGCHTLRAEYASGE